MKQDFIDYVRTHLKDYLPSEYQDAVFEEAELNRPNDVTLKGFGLRNDLGNTVPTIFLNNFEEDYENGADIEDIMHEIANLVEEQFRLGTSDVEGYADDIFNYEIMKPKLAIKLIDRIKSQEYLSDKPYVPFGNLAITYHLQLIDDNNRFGTSFVDNELVKIWNITKEQLHKDALKAERDRSEILLFSQGTTFDSYDNLFNSDEPLNGPLYLLTNEQHINGACAIVQKGVLKKLADRFGCDYFILPTTVHDITLIPVNRSNADLKVMDMMLQDFNRQAGLGDDFLSDHSLLYDRETGKLKYRNY